MRKTILLAALTAGLFSASAAYDVNFPTDSKISHGSRHLTSFTISVDGVQNQTLNVDQGVKGKLYFDLTDRCFIAMPGKKVNISFNYAGSWMNSYLYLDRDNNGVFDVDIDNGDADDLIAFSYYRNKEWNKGINSAGVEQSSGDNLKIPEFEIPADLQPGTYRLRLKIDWNNVDPGGATANNNGSTSENILTNGGTIVDAMVMVTNAECTLSVNSTNGTVTLADGSDPETAVIPSTGMLDFLVTPDPGYAFDGMSIIGGFEVPEGVTFVEPSLGFSEVRFTALSMKGDVLSIPVEYLGGHTEIEASFLPAESASGNGKYDSSYSGTKSAAEGFRQISVNGVAKTISSTELHTPASLMFNAQVGEPLSIEAAFQGEVSKYSLSVDYNQNGEFNTNTAALSCEVLAEDATPKFDGITLPVELGPGVYRARIQADGHSDIDFFLNVHKADADLNVQPLNALVLNSEQKALALTAPALTQLNLTVLPTLPGFVPEKIVIRHGQNLYGPEFVCGNPQWADYEATISGENTLIIPDSIVNGDLIVYAIYAESSDSEWTKVWGDEFNAGEFDANRWQYQERLAPTWKRFIASTDRGHQLVNTFENGCYNAHCFATPADLAEAEGTPMISGALMSQHRFDVKYGRIEARLKTTPHTGNFPAFWMLPTYSEIEDLGLKGWPRDGEIDIWEQINSENRSYHTIHSGWTKWSNTWSTPPLQYSPTSSGNVECDAKLWHVFALEWEEEQLRWYVDGKHVFTYNNTHYSEPGSDKYFEKITWPFDKHFYIIVNQSVGDGSWAANVDQSFHYLTLFDYVRVYQKKNQIDNMSEIEGNGDDPNFYVPAKGVEEIEGGNDNSHDGDEQTSIVDISADASADDVVEYFDLQGRSVAKLSRGLYITNGRKLLYR